MIRNAPPWPNGARCAVAFTFDVDADSVVHVAHRERAPDLTNAIAHMRYDPFVAMPRLVDLFTRYAVPVTHFVPGWVADTYPDVIKEAYDAGCEIAHHGYLHEWPSEQTIEEERHALERGIESIEKLTGKPPVGYRAPYYGVSPNTFDLLIEGGIEYDSSLYADDIPIVLETGRGSLLEIPVPSSVDDYNQYVSSRAFDYLMKVSSPRQALEVFRADFDALWEFGGLWVSVWHPAVSGRPAQSLAIRDLIEHMQRKGGVWFATMKEITDHVAALRRDGVWTPRTERIPYYDEPVLRTPG